MITGQLKIEDAVLVKLIDLAPHGLDRAAVKLRVVTGVDVYDITLLPGDSHSIDVTVDPAREREIVAA